MKLFVFRAMIFFSKDNNVFMLKISKNLYKKKDRYLHRKKKNSNKKAKWVIRQKKQRESKKKSEKT